jgi:hypothetical protein
MKSARGLWTFALLASACVPSGPGTDGGDPDGGIDAGEVISPVDLCGRLAAARCTLNARCFPAFATTEGPECALDVQTRCLAQYELLKPSFEAGKLAVDAAQLARCEQRMQTSSCPPTFPLDYPAISARAFSDCSLTTGLLVGSVPAGDTCSVPVECKPGTVCVKPGGVCLGTCSSWPVDGELCAFGCAPGLYCDDQGTPTNGNDDRCATPKPLDATCTDSNECEPELVCVGTCRPRAALNEPCRFDFSRLSTCEPGLACDITPYVSGEVGTCIVPRGEGGRCKFHWSCSPGLVCADLLWTGFPASAPVDQGFCRAPSEQDVNCPYTRYALYLGDQCKAGTGCESSSSKCKVAPKLGEPCAPSQQRCQGLNVFCKPSGSGDLGTCAGPAGIGDRCAFSVDANRTVTIPCRTGFCDATGTQACRAPSKQIGTLCASDGECISGRCAVQEDRTMKCANAC